MRGLWQVKQCIWLLSMVCCCCCTQASMVPKPVFESCKAVKDPVDCSSGFTAITSELCVARGCCYNENVGKDVPKCFYAVDGVPIEVVHMINSNHFDAGYADITANVINEYFDKYFLRAASIGAQLRALPAGTPGAGPLRWMTFSYLISLYFDCPSGMDLHCPSASAKKQVVEAIQAHDIIWAAFPHNAELATGDAAMLRFGVQMSQEWATRLGAEMPTVVSTRDVPGMPKASVSILAKAGVQGLSEGMNGRIVPINVPPAFQWSDGNSTLPTLWHWGGYGQLGGPGSVIRIPGSKHALAYCWRGDNAGPPESVDEVRSNVQQLQKQLGSNNLTVVSSSLNQYVNAISKETTHRDASPWSNLPVITQDLSDSWIWGVGSDPIKVQRMRAIHRARTVCEASGKHCGQEDVDYQNFSRLVLKNMEHTWGVSVSHYGPEADVRWSNENFHDDLAKGQENLMYMVRSWVEQRNYGINFPLAGLPQAHPVRTQVEAEIKTLIVDSAPDTSSFERLINPSVEFNIGDITVQLGNDGSLISLVDGDATWASKEFPLALLRYQTLDLDDFKTWQAEYLMSGSGGENEYGKPQSFMKAVPTPAHQLAKGSLTNAWKRADHEVLVQVAFEERLWKYYGAPHEAWIRYNFSSNHEIDVELVILNKTATRLPEAMFFTFRPAGSGTGSWQQSILGQWSDPLDVAFGASRGLHYTSEDGVKLKADHGTMQVQSMDTGLLRWDKPLPFPTPLHTQPNLTEGASFCLLNNIWNTNYPDWFPFDSIGSNMRFRFKLLLTRGENLELMV